MATSPILEVLHVAMIDFEQYEKQRWVQFQQETENVEQSGSVFSGQTEEYEEDQDLDERVAVERADANTNVHWEQALIRYDHDCDEFLKRRYVELGGDPAMLPSIGLSPDVDDAVTYRMSLFQGIKKEIHDTITSEMQKSHIEKRVHEVQDFVAGICARTGLSSSAKAEVKSFYPRDQNVQLMNPAGGGHQTVVNLRPEGSIAEHAMTLTKRYAILDIEAQQEELAAAVVAAAVKLARFEIIEQTLLDAVSFVRPAATLNNAVKNPEFTRKSSLTKFRKYFEIIVEIEESLRNLSSEPAGDPTDSTNPLAASRPWRESGLDPRLRGLGTRRPRK